MSVASLRAIQRIAERGRNRILSSDKETALIDIKILAEELSRGTEAWTISGLREDLAAWPGEPKVRNNGPRYLAAALDWLEAR